LPEDLYVRFQENRFALTFEVSPIIQHAEIAIRSGFSLVDIYARVGGVTAFLLLLGYFTVRPIICFWRDQELMQYLYKVAPRSEGTSPDEIRLKGSLENVDDRTKLKSISLK
jgi:hypothetical protein